MLHLFSDDMVGMESKVITEKPCTSFLGDGEIIHLILKSLNIFHRVGHSHLFPQEKLHKHHSVWLAMVGHLHFATGLFAEQFVQQKCFSFSLISLIVWSMEL